jgi:hypothetical protein
MTFDQAFQDVRNSRHSTFSDGPASGQAFEICARVTVA